MHEIPKRGPSLAPCHATWSIDTSLLIKWRGMNKGHRLSTHGAPKESLTQATMREENQILLL